MKVLEGRHALVTGGGRGIGAAIAAALCAAGARVTVMGRTEEALRTVTATLPMTQAVVGDVCAAASVAAALSQARNGFGPVDILINNAGAAISAPFSKQTADDLQRMLDVNLIGAWRCCQAVLPEMVTQGWGRIVTVASTAGLKAYGYVAGYVVAKHGAVGLTRALALEYAAKGVTVNAVCPGYTDTDMARNSIDRIAAKTGRSAAESRAALTRSNPQGRLTLPREVAAAVAWLCGPDAAAVNGVCLPIEGGETVA